MRPLPPPGLYAVTPDWDDADRLLARAAQLIDGGAVMLQHRNKTTTTGLLLAQAYRLRALCTARGIPFIVNDSVELCAAVGADGVHLGRSNTPIAEARELLGPNRIIGATCYGDPALAEAAVRDGANYVAFGGFFISPRKDYAPTTPHDIIRRTIDRLGTPVAVIGGMTPDNCSPLIEQGARWVAAIGSVFDVPDGEAAARQFSARFAAAAQSSTLGALTD